MSTRDNSKVILAAAGLVAGAAAWAAARFRAGSRRADEEWTTARYPQLGDIGSVERLSILPLVDSRASRPALATENGVAYLVRAGDKTILFDVGLNFTGEHPSPLLRNMQALGVTLDDIDAIVISHMHLDHVGGLEYEWGRTFSLSGQPVDLQGKLACVPRPMTHPTARVQVIDAPTQIAPGVISLGPIARQLFFFGWTPEQALAVNVAGKGLVLIIGCGHPTLQRIVARAEALCGVPLYGVAGGLHYPVTSRPVQRLLGTARWPWSPTDPEEVPAAVAFLKSRSPRLVALSPHDSCDWSRAQFREAFVEAYQDIEVGREITA